MISWKNSFKRLNEEYDLAKKKKQAVDNLYITGKISQLTRDTFNRDISAAIADIERQQKDLVEKMQLKTDELANQIKLLETLLANYEIQYVIGEIGDETYQRDILLFTIGIDTAKAELETITQATMQLCGPIPTIQAPIVPPLPIVEPEIATPTAPTETAAPVEFSIPIETPVESTPLETTSFETIQTPTEEPVMESVVVDAPVETPVMESVVVDTPAEELVMESVVVDTPVETPVMESVVVEEPIMESVVVEEPIMESVVVDAPVETVESFVSVETNESAVDVVVDAPVEELVMESTVDFVDAPVETVESFVSVDTDDSAIEIAATEPVFLTVEPAVEELMMESTVDFIEEAPIETGAIDLPIEAAAMDLIEEQTIADVADVPLQVFEVTEQAPVEQTLEKVMEQLNSPVVEALAVEELTHSSHPTTAPHQALSEITAEAVSDGQIDESDEGITE